MYKAVPLDFLRFIRSVLFERQWISAARAIGELRGASCADDSYEPT